MTRAEKLIAQRLKGFQKMFPQMHAGMFDFYLAHPESLNTALDAIVKEVTVIPGRGSIILKHSRKGTWPEDVTFMDTFFERWFKKERKLGKDKLRPMAKATMLEVRILHRTIFRSFPLPVHRKVYSYVGGSSTAACAANHVKKFAVMELDLKGFFPSFTREMIYEGYKYWLTQLRALVPRKHRPSHDLIDSVSRIIAMVCTFSDQTGEVTDRPIMPIGIPPAVTISNGLPYELDIQLDSMCKRQGVTYTRYSDNIYLSSDKHIPYEFRDKVIATIESFNLYGTTPFKVNAEKENYRPFYKQQRVLGAVVNEKVNVPQRRERWTRSSLNHLYHGLVDLINGLENRTTDKRKGWRVYGKLKEKSRVSFGNLAYFSAINKDKYDRYYGKMLACKIGLLKAHDLMVNRFKPQIHADVVEEEV